MILDLQVPICNGHKRKEREVIRKILLLFAAHSPHGVSNMKQQIRLAADERRSETGSAKHQRKSFQLFRFRSVFIRVNLRPLFRNAELGASSRGS
ncbi:MAG TPA: hypothetical protein DHU55_10935 [Blastocatellia bacterium]|nr:hypothetical protein [Blastocatellia bacterium]HAF22118.1 hypothetical protein [Blastocatellia bacterium]HCX30266.1 hypothetical protein [Blastocatellia bacterium]